MDQTHPKELMVKEEDMVHHLLKIHMEITMDLSVQQWVVVPHLNDNTRMIPTAIDRILHNPPVNILRIPRDL